MCFIYKYLIVTYFKRYLRSPKTCPTGKIRFRYKVIVSRNLRSLSQRETCLNLYIKHLQVPSFPFWERQGKGLCIRMQGPIIWIPQKRQGGPPKKKKYKVFLFIRARDVSSHPPKRSSEYLRFSED